MTDRTADPGRNLDLGRFRRHFRDMARIRAFEETALAALKEGLITGAIHPSIGQEAVASGVCGNLGRRDVLLSTHRGHGHTLAKGADVTAMMCELFGRAGGTSQGKGGSMHIADFSVGMLGANGVVAANIEIAAGAAHAIRLRREDGRIVCCIFGDGAVNRGPFLEGLNWAALYRLPVLFVCEDNGLAATTRTRAVTAGPGAAARAESLGIPATEVDGNDIVAVDEAARELISQVRDGPGVRWSSPPENRFVTAPTTLRRLRSTPEGRKLTSGAAASGQCRLGRPSSIERASDGATVERSATTVMTEKLDGRRPAAEAQAHRSDPRVRCGVNQRGITPSVTRIIRNRFIITSTNRYKLVRCEEAYLHIREKSYSQRQVFKLKVNNARIGRLLASRSTLKSPT